MAASVANSTAFRFSTGKAPGRPRHTGQTFVFGGSPKRVEQEQKILLAVSSWTCTSSPITGSYFARAPAEVSTDVAISQNYRGSPLGELIAWYLRWAEKPLTAKDAKASQRSQRKVAKK